MELRFDGLFFSTDLASRSDDGGENRTTVNGFFVFQSCWMVNMPDRLRICFTKRNYSWSSTQTFNNRMQWQWTVGDKKIAVHHSNRLTHWTSNLCHHSRSAPNVYWNIFQKNKVAIEIVQYFPSLDQIEAQQLFRQSTSERAIEKDPSKSRRIVRQSVTEIYLNFFPEVDEWKVSTGNEWTGTGSTESHAMPRRKRHGWWELRPG